MDRYDLLLIELLRGLDDKAEKAITLLDKVPLAARPTRLAYLTACRLIWRACPFVRVRRCQTLPGTDIFRAQTGPQGPVLMAENDWADGCGRFRLRIYDGTGSGMITQYFEPKTLARDFAFEDDRKE